MIKTTGQKKMCHENTSQKVKATLKAGMVVFFMAKTKKKL